MAGYGMDKQFAPNPVRILDPPDNPQARKNFSVSHLLDLEDVAAGMNGAKEAGPEARDGGKGAPEPSGGSSGSEGGALQEGERRRGRKKGGLRAILREMGSGARGRERARGCLSVLKGHPSASTVPRGQSWPAAAPARFSCASDLGMGTSSTRRTALVFRTSALPSPAQRLSPACDRRAPGPGEVLALGKIDLGKAPPSLGQGRKEACS